MVLELFYGEVITSQNFLNQREHQLKFQAKSLIHQTDHSTVPVQPQNVRLGLQHYLYRQLNLFEYHQSNYRII